MSRIQPLLWASPAPWGKGDEERVLQVPSHFADFRGCFVLCSSILFGLAWLVLRPSLSGWRPASAARRRPFCRTRRITPCYTLSHCGSVVRNLCDQAAEIDASVVAELPEDAASRIVVNYRLILPVGGRYQLLVFAVRHCCCYQCAKTQVAVARHTVACFGGHAWNGGHGDLVTGRLPFESSVSCMHVSEGYHEGGCSRLHMDWLKITLGAVSKVEKAPDARARCGASQLFLRYLTRKLQQASCSRIMNLLSHKTMCCFTGGYAEGT